MTLLVTLIALVTAVWGYMTAWFVLARLSNRTDVVDSAWGLGFVYLAWLFYAITEYRTSVKFWAAVFVSIWGLRLFAHITSRNLHKSEDYRYVAYREKWGDAYWQTAYTRIFMVQGILLALISVSTIAIMEANHPVTAWLAIAGFGLWGIGILFEAISDWQLRRFIRTKQPKQIMTTGLWRYSRHPNYFGEVVAWWGAAVVALSLGQWWGILGALTITLLITKVSGIPPLEKHYAGNKAFEAYKKRTSVFVPMPPKQS